AFHYVHGLVMHSKRLVLCEGDNLFVDIDKVKSSAHGKVCILTKLMRKIQEGIRVKVKGKYYDVLINEFTYWAPNFKFNDDYESNESSESDCSDGQKSNTSLDPKGFEERTEVIDSLSEELRNLDLNIDARNGLIHKGDKRLKLVNEIHKLERKQKDDLIQKSRIKWCTDRDENLKTIHGTINKKGNNYRFEVLNRMPTESEGFEQTADFLNANPIKYALTVNPTVSTSCIKQFWATVKAKIVNEEGQLQALVDGKKLEGMSNHNRIYVTPSHIKKIFRNMKKVGKGFSRRDTPLFPTMMTKQHRKPKRKVTEAPRPSNPTSVANEAVNEEMDDSLERAATTATSLDAECKEAMRDTVAQTRSERVSKISNDILLAGVNTPQSGEDSLKLNELMELCTKLQQRVLDLETIKTTQALETDNLKKRVKKLERKRRSRTHGLKRLYKVGLSTRVESSEDEVLGKEDASKWGRIVDIDANKDIYFVNVHNDNDMFGVNDSDGDDAIVKDAEMLFDVANALRGEEVFVSQEVPLKEVSVVDEVNILSTATTTTATINDITLAKALIEIKSAKPKTITASTRPKAKGLVIHDQEQAPTSTISLQQPSQVKDKEKRRKLFTAKRAEEKRNIPPTRSQQRSIMCTYLKNMDVWKLKILKKKSFDEIQELFDKAMKKVNTFVDFRIELVEKSSKKAEAELTQKDDVTIDATPLSSKSLIIVDYKIYKEGKKNYFQIFRADVEHMDSFLLHNLKTMFEHHAEDNNILYYLLVEKMYALTNYTLHQMFNDVKLQVDYEREMAFELLRLVKKQLKKGYGRIVGNKILHEVIAIKVRVTTAKINLVMFSMVPRSAMKRKIRDGMNTLFWHDVWINDTPLAQQFARLFLLEEFKNAVVVDHWNGLSFS
nr:RNA-directed DNA polymerase, eukaryota [Tanacetum cinerariifolium]